MTTLLYLGDITVNVTTDTTYRNCLIQTMRITEEGVFSMKFIGDIDNKNTPQSWSCIRHLNGVIDLDDLQGSIL